MTWAARSTVQRRNGVAAATPKVVRGLQQLAVTVPQRLFDPPTVSGLGLLRRHRPVLRLGERVTVVARRVDVLAVLADPETFATPYADGLAGAFVLGLDGEELRQHRRALEEALQAFGGGERDEPWRRLAADCVARAGDAGLAVGAGLVRPVFDEIVRSHLGLRAVDPDDFRDWSRSIFQDIFLNSLELPAIHEEGVAADCAFSDVVRRDLAARRADLRAGEKTPDDVMGRLIAGAQLSDDEIVDNLVGLAIGWSWHGCKAALLVVDALLSRPEALRLAQDAARAADLRGLQRVLWEALRFRTMQIGLPRTCTRDTTLSGGTPQETCVPAGATVLAGTQSAMWDGSVVPDPAAFDPSRADGQYLFFGHGSHRCLGEEIMRHQLPAVLLPLLAREDLRRAPGRRGRISWKGPSLDDLWVQFRR